MKKNSALIILIAILLNSCNFFSKKEEKDKNIANPDITTLNKEVDSLLKFNDSNGRLHILTKAFKLAELKEEDKALKVFHKVKQNAIKQKDTVGLALVYRCLGDFFEEKQVADSAFYYYNKSEKYYILSPENKVELARVILYKSGILCNMGILSEAEVETVKVLNILSGENQTRLEYEATVQLALILKDQKEKNALKYFNKIPELLKKLEKENYDKKRLRRSWISYYNNLGNYYKEINSSKAKYYYEISLNTESVTDFPHLYAMLLNNYASVLMDTQSKIKTVDSLLTKSFEIRQRLNHKEGIVGSQFERGQFFLIKGDTINALRWVKDAYNTSAKEKLNSDILQTLEFLAENDQLNRELYLHKYYLVKDSLHEIDMQTRNKFARIAYETDEIEEHNQFLQQRNLYLLLLAVCAFIVAGAVYIVFRLRMRNRKLYYQRTEQDNIQKIQTLIEKQQTVADNSKEEERQRIAGDLHDSVINRLFSTRINLQNIPIENTFEKQKLMEQLKDCEQQVRQISHDIAQNIFQREQNFSNVLKELILEQQNTFNTVFNCSIDKLIDWNDFTIKQKTQMYIIIQELLQNVNKHSKASNCFVFFLKQDNKLVIKLHDNGIGMNLEKIQKGLGLKNVDRRVKKLEGTFEIKQIDQLMIIIINIPYPKLIKFM